MCMSVNQSINQSFNQPICFMVNLRPCGCKAPNLPLSHHAPQMYEYNTIQTYTHKQSQGLERTSVLSNFKVLLNSPEPELWPFVHRYLQSLLRLLRHLHPDIRPHPTPDQ